MSVTYGVQFYNATVLVFVKLKRIMFFTLNRNMYIYEIYSLVFATNSRVLQQHI